MSDEQLHLRWHGALQDANRTSDYEIATDARDAYAAVMVEMLDRTDDMRIATEIRQRPAAQPTERTEFADFIREQGYDPIDLGA